MINNKSNNKKYVDLHLHTMFSDGTSTPEQVVKDCALLGLETIAIADHDHVGGYKRAKQEADKWGIELLPGVEITTNKYHILGLNVNLEHKEFLDFIDSSRIIGNKKAYKRVETLAKQGIPITKEKIDYYFPNNMLNKVHIAMTMLLDKECKSYVENTTNKNTTIGTIINTYFNKHTPAGNIETKEFYEPGYIIEMIHQAGGKAILAHPPKDVKSINEIDNLCKKGLDGIEIQPRYGIQNQQYIKYAKEHNLLTTFGSDFHGSRYIERPLLGINKHNNVIEQFWNL
ncbi:MAG: PHP domain-containing protein [Nanobdellota archaeon]